MDRFIIAVMSLFVSTCVHAQVELEPWGNLAGIRVEGQLMGFETGLHVVNSDWTQVKSTGKERQRPIYLRQGDRQVVTTSIDSIHFTVSAEDGDPGEASVKVRVRNSQASEANVYFSWAVPSADFGQARITVDSGQPFAYSAASQVLVDDTAKKISVLRFEGKDRKLVVSFRDPVSVVAKSDARTGGVIFYIPLHTGNFLMGDSVVREIKFAASGKIDRTDVAININPSALGRGFTGFGGNFRLQNPKADPLVIDYCLENMRVAFGRVEMPWRFWQPGESDHPIDSAKSSRIHPAVENAMLMAQRLSKKRMPIILSAWFPPAWAVEGEVHMRPTPDGVWGNPLDQSKAGEIYKSIADYILYLRDHYGADIDFFSFNESDLGINVRQTAAQHDVLIRGLGAYFKQAGLKTKMLLGDNSDATSYRFIDSAINDPAAIPFIGAVSFHSWRGWDSETLLKWKAAADRLHLPLIVAEGSIDAQAWGYPAIFEEPTYAREEINLYVRLLQICQPTAILQWQLTADYSPLSGGGIFGDDTRPLQPTQRFWNLKQLAATPEGLHIVDASTSDPTITVAALCNESKNNCVVHVVNNGASRKVSISGLPAGVKRMSVTVTDHTRFMKRVQTVVPKNGNATVVIDAGTFTTFSAM